MRMIYDQTYEIAWMSPEENHTYTLDIYNEDLIVNYETQEEFRNRMFEIDQVVQSFYNNKN